MDQLIEHYRVRALRGEIDPDVAEMQIVAYLRRDAAIREPRLTSIPRPKPAKHSGFVTRIRKTGS